MLGQMSSSISGLSRLVSRLNICDTVVKSQQLRNGLLQDTRFFSKTSQRNLKEIKITTEADMTTVEGITLQTEKDRLLPVDNPLGLCSLCPQKLKTDIKYTDVLILSQFLRPDGCLLPRYTTGLCAKAQTRLQKLVHQAQRAGLMPELRPDLPSGEQRTSLRSHHKWRKNNCYFTHDS